MAHQEKICALLVLLAGLAVACASAPAPAPSSASADVTDSASPSSQPAQNTLTPPLEPSGTASPIPTDTPTFRPTTTLTPPTQVFKACSPLLGIAPADLPGMVVNPYLPPPLGSDDPHQGVDLAQVQNGIALSGLPVQAALEGRVALVVGGRFPYGNALLVETPLDSLPPGWLEQLDLPSIPATPQVHSALTCPTQAAQPTWDFEKRSLYLLYAHLREPPALIPGDPVTCGQVIGAIGSSGNALNPHLHLEARVGPAGVRFQGMAHYDTSARPEEMGAYCEWRVGGSFLPFDPLLLFT